MGDAVVSLLGPASFAAALASGAISGSLGLMSLRT